MSPLIKRIAIVFLCLGLLLVVAAAAGIAYLNSGAFRKMAIGRIDAAIPGRIEWTHHRFAPFAGDFVIGGLRLLDAAGETLAGVERIVVSLRWRALLGRTVHISRVRIDAPVIFARLDANDRLNLVAALTPPGEPTAPDAAETPAKGLPFGLRLDDFQLQDGRVTFERPATAWSGTADAIAVNAAGNLAHPSGRLEVHLGTARFITAEVDHQVREIALAAAYDGRSADPITLSLHTPASRIGVSGRVTVDQEPLDMDLAARIDLDLAEVQAWLPPSHALSGRLEGTLSAVGTLDDPLVDGALTWHQGGVQGLDLERLDLVIGMAQRQVTLSRLALRAPWVTAELTGSADLRSVFPQGLTQPAAGMAGLDYAFTLAVQHLAPALIDALDLPLEGTWQLQAQLAGSGIPGPDGGSGAGEVELQGADLVLAEGGRPAPATLSLAAAWDARQLTLSRLQATLDQVTLATGGDGRLEWEGLQLALDGHLYAPRLAAIGELLGGDLPAAGTAALEFRLRGDVRRPGVHAVLLARALAWQEWTIGQLLLEADLDDDGVVHLPRLALENQGSFLEGSGRVVLLTPDGGLRSDPSLSLTLAFDPLDTAHFNAGLPADLRLYGKFQADGPLADPRATLTIAPSAVQWQDLAGQLEGTLRWAAGVLSIPELELLSERSRVQLTGTAQLQDAADGRLTDDPRIAARLTADPVQLADFLEGMQGELRLQAELDGALSGLQGRFELTGNDLDTGFQKVPALHLTGRLTPGRVDADALTITLAPDQTVRAEGWYGFDGRFAARVDAAGIELAHIDVLGPEALLQGRLELALTAEGSLSDPRAQGNLWLREPVIGERQWEDFALQLQLADQQLTLNGDLNFHMTADARLDSGDFNLIARFDNTDLAPYLALLGDALPWSGQLSGQVQVAGNRDAPADAHIAVDLTDTRLRYQDTDLLTIDQLAVRLADGVLDMPPTRVALLDEGYLTVAAGGALARDLTATVAGMLPLAVVESFTDAIAEARGEIRIDARMRGPVDDLQWEAELLLAQVGFLLPDLGQSVRTLNGRLTATPTRITLQDMVGHLDDGRFTLDGQVALADFKPTGGRLAIALQALPLQVPDTMDLRVSGDLLLTGDDQRARLSGDLVLLEGAYYKDLKLNLLAAVTETQRAAPVPTTEPPPEWMEAIDLDVRITHRYPFLVDNNVARLDILPDLRLTGTAARPLLDGRAQVGEGEVYFRRKAFTVTRGVVDFIHPYRIEPTLDIVAETRIRQWRIVLAATGPPDNLAIALRSEPPESDSDILSLILLGRTTSETGGTGGGATTEQMLASLVGSALGEDIKRTTGVDIFEVETGSPEPGESSDRIQVTVGKRISSRLLVKYAVETSGGETVQRAVSEYRLLEHILASGFQDSAGVYGGELLFRMEFR